MPSRPPSTTPRSRLAARAAALRRRDARARLARRRRARPDARAYQQAAQRRLRRFRQASTLAVVFTGLLLLLWGAPEDLAGQELEQAAAQAQTQVEEATADATEEVGQAAATIGELAREAYALMPRVLLVLMLFGIAAVAARVLHSVMRRALGSWERGEAASALARLGVYAIAVVAAVSILAGDVRAVVGSVGLIGLAASWALQTPIESFTGWLLNSFRGYYRVGDRIAVGDVFGDVYRIDVLTTTVWEAGGPGKAVSAAQPTGALITFPNWEVLRSNIVNYTRDFGYVWDEVTFSVANESDLAYAARVIEETARTLLGDQVGEAAERYQRVLQAERLAFDIEELPRVYLSLADSWTDCTVRYVVPVRARRRWSSDLVLAVTTELAKPEHKARIRPAYPRTDITVLQTPDSGA